MKIVYYLIIMQVGLSGEIY